MKKVQSKKLSLGKMAVAKLRLSQQQMQFLKGGEATKPTVQGTANSFVDDPPCVTQSPSIKTGVV
jgi:hypothetical protein